MSLLIADDRKSLRLELASGIARFHAVWLRDNSLHPDTKSAGNGQRLISLLDQSLDVTIKAAVLEQDVLNIEFSDGPAQHIFPVSWLDEYRYDQELSEDKGWVSSTTKLWGTELNQAIPSQQFDSVESDPQVLKQWLSDVRCYGFALITDLPDHPEAFLKVVDWFGYVRETNYGRYFEVRSEVNPVNLAYTSQGLQAHTDNPYRDPVPSMQILACLENSTDGGESIVIDGFNAATQLQKENPEHCALLSSYCARFKYAGEKGVSLQSKRPMIELNADGELLAVRFNNRSAAPFVDIPFDKMPVYYGAYRHFSEILERAENRVSFKLQARQLFIVDNTRVMHSRTEFSGSGTRWLRGCYPDKDGLLSTLASLEVGL
jgi:gamma-butyrobetaine dioxygenase